MRRAPIPIRALPGATGGPVCAGRDGLEGYEPVWIPMTADDRRRVHRLLEVSDGTLLALELPTGTILRPGQMLYAEGRRAYVVDAAPEDVLLIRLQGTAEAARAGHLIGNLHKNIEVTDDGIVALWDSPLEDRLRRAGFAVERIRRPFHGNPPGEHAH
jgi:urease accessory protein